MLLAQAATDWALIRRDAGLPTRIPPELQQAFEIVDDPDSAAVRPGGARSTSPTSGG